MPLPTVIPDYKTETLEGIQRLIEDPLVPDQIREESLRLLREGQIVKLEQTVEQWFGEFDSVCTIRPINDIDEQTHDAAHAHFFILHIALKKYVEDCMHHASVIIMQEIKNIALSGHYNSKTCLQLYRARFMGPSCRTTDLDIKISRKALKGLLASPEHSQIIQRARIETALNWLEQIQPEEKPTAP